MSEPELCQRLREGIDAHDPIIVAQAETYMEAAADEIDRLRAREKKLVDLLQIIATRLQVAGGAFPTLIDSIRAAIQPPPSPETEG